MVHKPIADLARSKLVFEGFEEYTHAKGKVNEEMKITMKLKDTGQLIGSVRYSLSLDSEPYDEDPLFFVSTPMVYIEYVRIEPNLRSMRLGDYGYSTIMCTMVFSAFLELRPDVKSIHLYIESETFDKARYLYMSAAKYAGLYAQHLTLTSKGTSETAETREYIFFERRESMFSDQALSLREIQSIEVTEQNVQQIGELIDLSERAHIRLSVHLPVSGKNEEERRRIENYLDLIDEQMGTFFRFVKTMNKMHLYIDLYKNAIIINTDKTLYELYKGQKSIVELGELRDMDGKLLSFVQWLFPQGDMMRLNKHLVNAESLLEKGLQGYTTTFDYSDLLYAVHELCESFETGNAVTEDEVRAMKYALDSSVSRYNAEEEELKKLIGDVRLPVYFQLLSGEDLLPVLAEKKRKRLEQMIKLSLRITK